MVYNQLPNNTMWMSVAHLNDFINTSFAVDLSVVANRQSMLRAINRMRSIAPFTRNSRFPARTYHISLEGEWYSVFMRLTQLLSQRDRAANITTAQTDNIRNDNNMRALFAVVEEINELRTRRYGFLDRETFEESYPWEDNVTTAQHHHDLPQMDQLRQQMADIASTLRNHTPIAANVTPTPFTEEDIRVMSTWARPYPYTSVKEQMVHIKRSVIDELMNNPSASRVIPSEDDMRKAAIRLLDQQFSFTFTDPIPVAKAEPVPEAEPYDRMATPLQHMEAFSQEARKILDDGFYDVDGDEQVREVIKQASETIKAIKAKTKKPVVTPQFAASASTVFPQGYSRGKPVPVTINVDPLNLIAQSQIKYAKQAAGASAEPAAFGFSPSTYTSLFTADKAKSPTIAAAVPIYDSNVVSVPGERSSASIAEQLSDPMANVGMKSPEPDDIADIPPVVPVVPKPPASKAKKSA